MVPGIFSPMILLYLWFSWFSVSNTEIRAFSSGEPKAPFFFTYIWGRSGTNIFVLWETEQVSRNIQLLVVTSVWPLEMLSA